MKVEPPQSQVVSQYHGTEPLYARNSYIAWEIPDRIILDKLKRYVGGRLKRYRTKKELARVLKTAYQNGPLDFSFANWNRSLKDPTGFYLDCVRFFHAELPKNICEHRHYFQQERRGFGEDPFHVMWWMIFIELRPARFLEIGVYRGQTLSLAALLQAHLSIHGQVTGISPFTSAGDAVSKYREDVDYMEDTLKNFTHFKLPKPELIKALSTDSIATERIAATEWDCVYIDGCHDYDVALQDWRQCSAAIRPGGVAVLDDAALGTSFQAPSFATLGHPGPSRLASEIDPKEFTEVLRAGHNRVFRKKG